MSFASQTVKFSDELKHYMCLLPIRLDFVLRLCYMTETLVVYVC